MPYIDLGITTDSTALADAALDYLSATIPGYEPQESDNEVILLNAVSEMAATLSDAAGTVPLSIFTNFGTTFFNLPYNQGSYAQVNLTFVAQDSAGYTIPAGTDIAVGAAGGMGFQLPVDAVIPNGVNSVSANAVAVDIGVAYNGLASNPQLVSALSYITSLTVNGASAGGSEAETDLGYANRLANYLSLLGIHIVTAQDAATFVLAASVPADPPSLGSIAIGRSTAVDGFAPNATVAFTATTANASPNLTVVTTTANMGVGTVVTGAGIPSSTYVLSTGSGTITLSKNATASASGVSLTATGLYNQAGNVSLIVTDPTGLALTSGQMSQIQTYIMGGTSASGIVYGNRRMTGAVFSVLPPVYTTINIAYTANILPTFVASGVSTVIAAALANYLNSELWGGVTQFEANYNWLNRSVVRFNSILRVIEDCVGVDFVPTGGLTLNGTTADVIMGGVAPLPVLGAVTPTLVQEIS